MQNELSFLEMLNEHPIAGAMMIAMLLIIAQVIKAWKGETSAGRIERENNKLAKQTSEVVNHCAARTHALMESMEKFMAENDVRHLHTKLDTSLHMLEKVHGNSSDLKGALVRVDAVCHDILSTIERADSRVVHNEIVAKVNHLQSVVDDVKRIAISTLEKR